MAYRQIEVECSCGKTLPVENIETTLENEDFYNHEVNCECGERYIVSLRLEIRGKKK